MRLTEIKLAGFKSFVDPTHIAVPGQRVGIVGPNGCGKSNIIDAVRWVLGESSARHLRGETMQDVLFNGSGNRQPVNRASVELIFDNSQGRAAGQWSNYAEISVKRVLERDGESSYYVNNIHVRRRDVADIFLGTGVGARAYAIIEQGMISRIIEAKPEELRIFLEEAAGTSKYRERRRETEARLSDTRENLLRVEDIRTELDKQLDHLRGQAEVAKQYHLLQQQLRDAQQMLWLLKKREAGGSRERSMREIEKLEVTLEGEIARLRETERKLEELRERHYAAGEAVHVAQGGLYEANSEFSRIEQQIQHLRDSRQRVESQLAALRGQFDQAQAQLKAQHASREQWSVEQAQAQQQSEASQSLLEQELARLPLAEQAFRAGLDERDTTQRSVAENAQALQVARTRQEHAERNLAQLVQREQRLREEQAALAPPDSEALNRLGSQAVQLEAEYRAQRGLLDVEDVRIPQIQQDLREQAANIEAAAQKVTAIEARLAALVQIQERIARSDNMHGWLQSHDLDRARHLWQDIEIESGWEDALEAVLRERINGIGLANLSEAGRWLGDVPPGKLTLYAANGGEAAVTSSWAGCEPLAAFVRCNDGAAAGALKDWLHQVYVVRERDRGLQLAQDLPAGAMLVSGDGHVFSRHSVSFHAPDSELHGVLSRQREIEQLGSQIDVERQALTAQRAGYARAESRFEERRSSVHSLRSSVEDLQRRQHALQLEMLKLSEQAQRVTQRGAQIAAELSEIEGLSQLERAQEAAAREACAVQQTRQVDLGGLLAAAVARYAEAEAVLDAQRASRVMAERAAQDSVFHLRSCNAKIIEVENAIRMIEDNLEVVRASMERHQQELAGLDDAALSADLERAIAVRGERERALASARDALSISETEQRQLESDKSAIEQGMAPMRDRIGDLRLREQEARLTEEQYSQQLQEAGANEAEIESRIEKGKRSGALQSEIASLGSEISQLGAVNLAALEELDTAQQRKNYLDAQSQDLIQALTTLEDAIRRIDRETRDRLQQTFDQVNMHFGRLFPSLFGGGQAKLLLTGEEILDSGVQVMAQPPGKKNSSIHLLSGGEKALTALSLVFAMFQLNAAPFCLLDEVDAPLDDSNTERFCELVTRMSEHSQFLFISHNKITMEIANQLVGITMQEAGVSRVVAVDIEEAMKLAAEAA